MRQFSTAIFCICTALVSAQTPFRMPEATVYDRLNQPVSTSQLASPYGPTVVVTYASSWGYGAMDLMDEMDSLYQKQDSSSKIHLVGLNVDNSASYYKFFTEANSHHWQHFYILHDSKGTYLKAAKSRNAYQVFFLNEKGEILYCVETCDFDAQDVYDYCKVMLRGEAHPDTIYFNEHWFPCEKQKAKYYRPLPTDSSGSFHVRDYYIDGNPQMDASLTSVYPRWRNGILEYYYPTGKQKERGSYKENVKYGNWISWYENDSIHFETGYFNGKKQGIEKEYFETGSIKSECYYFDGIPDGISNSYYPNDTLQNSTTWQRGMMLNSTGYYDNGQLKYRTLSSAAITQGFANSFYPTGMAVNEIELGDDLGILLIKQFYESGEVKGVKTHEEDGSWKYTEYYPGGKTKFTFSMNADGILNGEFTEFYENGNKKHVITFKDGTPVQTGMSMYENGNVKEKLDYSTDLKSYFSVKGKKLKRGQTDDLEMYRSAHDQRVILLQSSEYYMTFVDVIN